MKTLVSTRVTYMHTKIIRVEQYLKGTRVLEEGDEKYSLHPGM